MAVHVLKVQEVVVQYRVYPPTAEALSHHQWLPLKVGHRLGQFLDGGGPSDSLEPMVVYSLCWCFEARSDYPGGFSQGAYVPIARMTGWTARQ